MNEQQFKIWLDALKKVWEERDPNKVGDLCAEKFQWYESPFDKPITKKEQLVKEWQNILKQENIQFSYQITSTKNSMCIAEWNVSFTIVPSKEVIQLAGIFKFLLNKDGDCIEFHQWYNIKEL